MGFLPFPASLTDAAVFSYQLREIRFLWIGVVGRPLQT